MITSTRLEMACLFSTDSCNICLLERIIYFLLLRFIYKHTDEKIQFGNPILLGISRYFLLQVALNQMQKKNLENKKQIFSCKKEEFLLFGNDLLFYDSSC